MEIRPLRPDDDRSAFHSDDEALDRYFRSYAGQNQFRHHLGVTYVAVEDGRVLGFATISPGQIDIEGLPVPARKGLPRYPLPILRLARLAIDQSARARGIGTQLLGFACRMAAKMADEYGCVGVAVDAKPGAIEFYERYGFVPHDPLEGRSQERPGTTWMFLAMRAILAASDASSPP